MKQTMLNTPTGCPTKRETGISKELYVKIEESMNLRKALSTCSNAKTLEAITRNMRHGCEKKRV